MQSKSAIFPAAGAVNTLGSVAQGIDGATGAVDASIPMAARWAAKIPGADKLMPKGYQAFRSIAGGFSDVRNALQPAVQSVNDTFANATASLGGPKSQPAQPSIAQTANRMLGETGNTLNNWGNKSFDFMQRNWKPILGIGIPALLALHLWNQFRRRDKQAAADDNVAFWCGYLAKMAESGMPLTDASLALRSAVVVAPNHRESLQNFLDSLVN